MDSGRNVLVYYHNPEFLDRYQKLLEEARQDLNLLICRDEAAIANVVKDAEIIFAGHTFPMHAISRAKRLQWIQAMGAGVENFVRSKAIPPHVTLTKIRGLFGSIMAEYVLGYMLALTQRMEEVFENKRKKQWAPFLVESIRSKTVGVMGLGSVGSTLAYRIHLAGAKVIGLVEQERALPYVERVYLLTEMDAFLQEVDFLVLALPLTDRTEGILGDREFAQMKQSAYLINVARGPLVQEGALLDALSQERIAGAVLDVFDEEPLPANHPLWEAENVVLTPHISGPSLPEETTKIFLRNLKRFEEGKTLEGVVDISKGY